MRQRSWRKKIPYERRLAWPMALLAHCSCSLSSHSPVEVHLPDAIPEKHSTTITESIQDPTKSASANYRYSIPSRHRTSPSPNKPERPIDEIESKPVFRHLLSQHQLLVLDNLIPRTDRRASRGSKEGFDVIARLESSRSTRPPSLPREVSSRATRDITSSDPWIKPTCGHGDQSRWLFSSRATDVLTGP